MHASPPGLAATVNLMGMSAVKLNPYNKSAQFGYNYSNENAEEHGTGSHNKVTLPYWNCRNAQDIHYVRTIDRQ